MKYILLFTFSFCSLEINAQTDSIITKVTSQIIETDSGYYNSYTRAKIGLKDQSVLYVNQITTHLNEVSVEYDPKKIPVNAIYTIPVEQITFIKFKRGSFIQGLVAGAVIGGFLGAVVGGVSYRYDFSKTEEDNKESKELRKVLYGAGGAVPLGLLGSLIGPIVIKKTFYINGDREKMNKIMKKRM